MWWVSRYGVHTSHNGLTGGSSRIPRAGSDKICWLKMATGRSSISYFAAPRANATDRRGFELATLPLAPIRPEPIPRLGQDGSSRAYTLTTTIPEPDNPCTALARTRIILAVARG